MKKKVKVYLLWELHKCDPDMLAGVTGSKEEAEEWDKDYWNYFVEYDVDVDIDE